MFPVSPAVVILFLIVYAFVGVATGTVTGIVLCLSFGLGTRGIWKDGLLGSLGFVLGIIGCASLPWPENTVVTTEVTSTMNRFQHPYPVAFTLALLLPLVREIYRLKQSKTAAGQKPN